MHIIFIIVAYRVEESLFRTLKSIDVQTYSNYSIYLKIKKKPLEEKIREIRKFKNITVIISEDEGVYSAINQAVEKIKPKFGVRNFVIILGQGDGLYSKSTLSDIFDQMTFQDNSHKLYYCKVNHTEEEFSERNKDPIWNVKRPNPFSGKNFIPCHQGIIEDFEIIKNIKFNERYKICGDAEHLYSAILKYKINPIYLNLVISTMPLNGLSSRTAGYPVRLKERLVIALKYYFTKCLSIGNKCSL